MKGTLVAGAAIVVGILVCAPSVARADTITFQLGPDDFSGSADASGPIYVTLTDLLDGSVRMTVDASGLSGDEFVGQFYLNFDPDLSIGGLSASYQSGVSAGSPTIATDCCKADGDGLYDIWFDYPTDAGSRLGVGADSLGTVSVYDFFYTGSGTFDVYSFNFLSAPAGGHGPFIMAAHIQGIGPNGQLSGWISAQTTTGEQTTTDQPTTTNGVPEPAGVLLVGMGLLLAGRRLRRKVT